jgi:hypothetical protein
MCLLLYIPCGFKSGIRCELKFAAGAGYVGTGTHRLPVLCAGSCLGKNPPLWWGTGTRPVRSRSPCGFVSGKTLPCGEEQDGDGEF